MKETTNYPKYFARFYDTIYAKLRKGVDSDYFLDKIMKTNGKVLEVGVGTGRFFLQSLQQGVDIYGIDVSTDMLEVLRSKLDKEEHFRVSEQNVCELNLNQTFDLIVAPFRVFAHLLTIEDQLKALNKIHEHLNPGGRFIFDLYLPNLNILLNGISKRLDFEGEYEIGKKLQRYVSAKADLINQLNYVTMSFIWQENGGTKEQVWEFPMRYYFRYELEHLIKHSKLKLDCIYGDYEERQLTNDSKDFVIVCVKE